MQIIESTDYGVRAAELRLIRRSTPLQFVLYPMMHIGSPEFYAEVTRRLRSVDLIVAEGIGGGSDAVSSLVSSYEVMTEDDDLGLVVQDLDYEAIGVPVINPDQTGEEFDQNWRTLPLWQRAATRAALGSLTAAQKLLGTRRMTQFQLDHATMDDLPSLAELLAPDAIDNFNRVLVDDRDKLLLSALTRLHETRADEPVTVAVVYGAFHMRAVLKGMHPLGYRVAAGDWIDIKRY